MGDVFSTRWNGVSTRQETGPLYALIRRSCDAGEPEAGHRIGPRMVHHAGGAGGIDPRPCHGRRPHANLSNLAHGGEWRDMRERVALETTPCRYGGRRPWFRCPRCGSRRRVLYSVGGVFRCRRCHDLAYTSTREDAQARSARRIAALHTRLEAAGADLYAIPPRPAGMRQATYRSIVDDLRREQDRQAAYYRADLERLMSRAAASEHAGGTKTLG